MTATDSRARRRSGVSAAAPAAHAAPVRGGGRTFHIVSLVVLVVLAILWLIPSLFAVKTSLTENGVVALGAQEILTELRPTLASSLPPFGTAAAGP